MTESQLAERLKEMCEDGALHNKKVAKIHLFGVVYASKLESLSISNIVRMAGLPSSYAARIRDGMRLSEYVTPITQ